EATGGGGFLGRLWRAVRGTAQRVGPAAGRAANAVGGWLAATPREGPEPVARGGPENPPRGFAACARRRVSSVWKSVRVRRARALWRGNPGAGGGRGRRARGRGRRREPAARLRADPVGPHGPRALSDLRSREPEPGRSTASGPASVAESQTGQPEQREKGNGT